MALGPAGVHAVEHLGPVLGLGAARAGVDGEYGVVRVVLAGEQGGEAHGLQLALELGVVRLQLAEHGVVVLLQRHLADDHEVVPGGAELFVFFALLLELLEALLHLLAPVDVVPEAVLGALGLELGYLGLRVVELERRAQTVQRGLDVVQFDLIFLKFKHIFNRFPKN